MSENRTLLDRNVFYACDLENEAFANFHGELSRIRKSFFESLRRPQSIRKPITESGFSGKLKGSISGHKFKWKKTLGKITTEEAFLRDDCYVLVRRDMNGRISSKLYYNKSLRWTKTEYFSPDNYISPKASLYPDEKEDKLILETRNDKTELYAVPYESGTAMQKPQKSGVLVSAQDGEYLYCSRDEQQIRLEPSAEEGSTLMFVNTWEVKDGEIPPSAIESEPEFSDLDNPAEMVELKEAETTEEVIAEEKSESSDAHEKPQQSEEISDTYSETEAVQDENAESSEKESEAQEAEADEAAEDKSEPVDKPDTSSELMSYESVTEESVAEGRYNYTGKMRSGKRQGRGRTETIDGITIFDGEYLDDMKHGFGASYYKDGSLSFVGEWKEDKKNGLGISFRAADHAVHISGWENGKPGDTVTLLDSDGNLKYSGKISDGKKNGTGITVRKEDGFIYVGSFVDGEISGQGSLFDEEGLLVYNGHWENGLRNGTGTEFDKSGSIVYSGEWKDDKYLNGILYQKI